MLQFLYWPRGAFDGSAFLFEDEVEVEDTAALVAALVAALSALGDGASPDRSTTAAAATATEVGAAVFFDAIFFVPFFFLRGGGCVFFGAPLLRFFNHPVIWPASRAAFRCIALRGTAGVSVVVNWLGGFFFVIVGAMELVLWSWCSVDVVKRVVSCESEMICRGFGLSVCLHVLPTSYLPRREVRETLFLDRSRRAASIRPRRLLSKIPVEAEKIDI